MSDHHPLDRPIASELSQLVIEKRRRQMELVTQSLDSTNQALYSMGGVSIFDAYIADRPAVGDSYQGEGFQRRYVMRKG